VGLGPTRANINAHAMVLAAYDPTHTEGGNTTPWGFISSWNDGTGDHIYWMSDADFLSAYNYDTTWIGSNNVVIITNTP